MAFSQTKRSPWGALWAKLDPTNENNHTASGKVEMDYKDFGLPVVRAMLVMTVDPKLVVNFQVVGKLK